MKKLTTFEDIFNKLVEDYQGETVEVKTRQDGVNIASFRTRINNIVIKPLNKRQSRKWSKSGAKIGLIIVQEKRNRTRFNIPFILGFNTMKAVFLKSGVTIKTLNMEFIIKKEKARKKQLA